MNKSIWRKPNCDFTSLSEDCSCDVFIVGGGLTGISLAYYLKDANLQMIVIEQNQIGGFSTCRSTAKLTYLQKDLLSKIKISRGFEAAKLYYQAQKSAIQNVLRIIKQENISCHLEKSPSYLFVQEKRNIQKLQKEFQLYKKLGAPVQWKKHLPFQVGEQACFFVPDTYVFHPTEYLQGLIHSISKSSSIQIYEKTRFINYSKNDEVYTISLENNVKVKAKHLVFAGQYPPFLIPYLFPFKTSLEKDFVQTKNHTNLQFNAINLDSKVLSIRFFENQLIQVIDAKRLGNSAIQPNYNSKDVPDSCYAWNNYDVITPDSLPIVGYIGTKRNGLFLATGYNTWGMTNSNLAAEIIANAILGKKHLYQNLFQPQRHISLFSFGNQLLDNIFNISHFVSSYFPFRNSAKTIWKDGKRMGIVIDSKGKKHEVLLTCPHMKCGLRYNSLDNTWDCPCHGSRFDVDGKILRGPATQCVQPQKRK